MLLPTYKKHQLGFTLIELLVAVFVFSLIIAVSLGSVFVIINANKKAQSLKSVVSNLNFALEVMSRDIRFGNTYNVSSSGGFVNNQINVCPGRNMPLHVGAAAAQSVTYYLKKDTLTNKGIIMRRMGTDMAREVAITSSELDIQSLSFNATDNTNTGLGKQQNLLISTKGTATLGKNAQTDFAIQTTISTRCIQCISTCTQ